jgi:DNA-binding NtrC family response regulator
MNKTALIFQEEIILQNILKKMLASIGYSCLAFSSHESMENIPSKIYDVVITDVLFEGISSLEYLSTLKGNIKFKRIFVVSDMQMKDLKKNISAILQVDGFYEPPFDIDKLKENILKIDT